MADNNGKTFQIVTIIFGALFTALLGIAIGLVRWNLIETISLKVSVTRIEADLKNHIGQPSPASFLPAFLKKAFKGDAP